jgi:hypothetical protein
MGIWSDLPPSIDMKDMSTLQENHIKINKIFKQKSRLSWKRDAVPFDIYFLRLGASLFFAKLEGVGAGRGGRFPSCLS